MIKYKGWIGIVQYIPKKTVKRGKKVWMMCASSFLDIFIILKFIAERKTQCHNLIIVLDIMWNTCSNTSKTLEKDHHLYFNRFFYFHLSCEESIRKRSFSEWDGRKKLPANISKIKLKKIIYFQEFQWQWRTKADHDDVTEFKGPVTSPCL